MSKIRKRPTLVVLDFRAGQAARYVPKLLGGFFRETANIAYADGTCGNFGGPEGSALIERFRTGQMAGQELPEDQLNPELERA